MERLDWYRDGDMGDELRLTTSGVHNEIWRQVVKHTAALVGYDLFKSSFVFVPSQICRAYDNCAVTSPELLLPCAWPSILSLPGLISANGPQECPMLFLQKLENPSQYNFAQLTAIASAVLPPSCPRPAVDSKYSDKHL